jgi:lambda family phage minor tail protein L
MSNIIATDVQDQEVDSGLLELFQITLPNGTTIYFHPGLDEDSTNIKFRDKEAPNNPMAAGTFVIGTTYTVQSVGYSNSTHSTTDFTSIGSSSNAVGTSFVATGVGTGTGTANQVGHAIREYIPFPIMVDGLDIQADGASTRPALTIANIGTLFSSQLDGFKNDDLVGQRLIRRQTFKKYLYGESGDSSPPVEFRTQEYIIDRIASENAVSVTFEVAAPFDLEGIKLPRRVVVGKYCSWQYQGHDAGKGGGCTWKLDSSYNYRDGSENTFAHKAFFDFDDRPLVNATSVSSLSSYSASTAYTTVDYVNHSGKKWLCIISGTDNTPSETSAYWKQVFTWSFYSNTASYSKGDLVKHLNTIWKSVHNDNEDNTPEHGDGHWVQEELCGKTLQSCKARYGCIPAVTTSANQNPSGRKNSAARLPFGSFPGTNKY